MHRSLWLAVTLVAIMLSGLCSTAALAAEVDLALRLERFRPGQCGQQQWVQLYPVPQREALLAYG